MDILRNPSHILEGHQSAEDGRLVALRIEAQRRADQIRSQAREEAENIRAEADDYVIDSLRQLEAELDRNLNQVRNGIRTVEEEQARRAPSSPAPSQAQPAGC